MININGKDWNTLEISDIEEFLTRTETENFFFDNKDDTVSNEKITKEVSAFANTFGGYIFIGVTDENKIQGCSTWNEERIHNVIHDTITPTPIIDVKQLTKSGKTILLIRVEEGQYPPYVTNKGVIYERLSSGSYPIKSSEKLDAMYRKRADNDLRIKDKIENSMPAVDCSNINNLMGYIDVGFSVTTKTSLNLFDNFYNLDLEPVSELLKSNSGQYTFSRSGHAFQVTTGLVSSKDNFDRNIYLYAGLNNYMEILADGSMCCRVLLTSDGETDNTDITSIMTIGNLFRDIYNAIVDEDFEEKFVYANKYEKLHVFKQFIPRYQDAIENHGTMNLRQRHYDHIERYGGTRVVSGSRIPRVGYATIDKAFMDRFNIQFNRENLIDTLFSTAFLDLGYIEPIVVSGQENEVV